jgi:hypothetical protein
VGWAVGQEAVIVRVGALAPSVVGIVAGLLGEDRFVVAGEVDVAVVVGMRFVRVHRRRLTDRAGQGSVDGVTQPPSPYSQQGSDEQIWARPTYDGGAPTGTPPAVHYSGPPRAVPAPPGWKPPTLIQVPAAHALPEQDDKALDQQERAARTITNGVGMIAGAIALLVLIVICGRVLF